MVVHVCEASKQQQRKEDEEQASLVHIAGLPGRLGRRKGNPDEEDKFLETHHLTRSNQKSQSS